MRKMTLLDRFGGVASFMLYKVIRFNATFFLITYFCHSCILEAAIWQMLFIIGESLLNMQYYLGTILLLARYYTNTEIHANTSKYLPSQYSCQEQSTSKDYLFLKNSIYLLH